MCSTNFISVVLVLFLVTSLEGFQLCHPSVSSCSAAFATKRQHHHHIVQAESFGQDSIERRVALQTIATILPITTSVVSPFISNAIVTNGTINPTIIEATESYVIIPIQYIPALSAYVINYYLFGEPFSGIVDTGSPFLTAPSTCSKWSYKYKWGCYHPEMTYDSGYANTIEGFDNNQGPVVWRRAEFAFDDTLQAQNLTFGVFGPDLLDGPGGVFFGLIKNTDSWIRPSFLGQMGYSSFSIDLRQTPRLILSKQPLITGNNYIPLVRDLSRRYNAPVVHYTAKASSFIVNGLPLRLDAKTPTYVIFDTGLSGMAVSDELFEGRNLQARKNKEKSLWGEVSVTFETIAGSFVEMTAKQPITTPLGQDTPWTRFKGNLVVLGLAFLDQNVMTIDIDDQKLQFVQSY